MYFLIKSWRNVVLLELWFFCLFVSFAQWILKMEMLTYINIKNGNGLPRGIAYINPWNIWLRESLERSQNDILKNLHFSTRAFTHHVKETEPKKLSQTCCSARAATTTTTTTTTEANRRRIESIGNQILLPRCVDDACLCSILHQ